jgi:hypothetical protein
LYNLSQLSYFFWIFTFYCHYFFSFNMHILCPTFGYCINHPKKTNQQFMFQMWVLQIILTNYCVFYDLYANISHWILCFWSSFNAIMQHCNMFQTCIFRENFNKVLMQYSHSKHVNIIQMWGYNCNKTKLLCHHKFHRS